MEKKEDILQETEAKEDKKDKKDIEDTKDELEEKAKENKAEEVEEKEEAAEEDVKEDAEKAEANKQLEDLNNKLLRLQADFINYKNRVEREKENIYSYALEDIMSQLLPVLDNFERALNNMEEANSYYEGVKMIYDQMVDVLSKNGLKEIDCLNKPFDPNFHHAVMSEESDKEEGTILEVLQKGYMLKDKVIRPSMVKVAK